MSEYAKRELEELHDRYVPRYGPAETELGEIVRATVRIFGDWYNNGAMAFTKVMYRSPGLTESARYLGARVPMAAIVVGSIERLVEDIDRRLSEDGGADYDAMGDLALTRKDVLDYDRLVDSLSDLVLDHIRRNGLLENPGVNRMDSTVFGSRGSASVRRGRTVRGKRVGRR